MMTCTVLQGPALAIHQSEEVLAGMNPWCIEHHGKSGLTQRVRESKVDMAQAQDLVSSTFCVYRTWGGCCCSTCEGGHC